MAPNGAEAGRGGRSGDLSRTIDQVKRLYAVIMGYALTQCFSRVYAAAQKLPTFWSPGTLTLAAEAISFCLLISLIYLGAERMLDSRYLGADSEPPSARGLLVDLTGCGLTAAWFVVLADTFPDLPVGADYDQLLSESIKPFTLNLLLLYLTDTFFLAVQLLRIGQRRRTASTGETYRAHAIWLSLNVASALLVLPVLINDRFAGYLVSSVVSGLTPGRFFILFTNPSNLSLYVLVLNLARFLLDYFGTFRAYIPDQARRVAAP